MRNLVKSFYYKIPFKKELFLLLRNIRTPSPKIAGYLKFHGVFSITAIGSKKLKIQNDHSTLPTLLFWNGLYAHEKHSMKIWEKLCKEGAVIFDIGANFGLFGLIAQLANQNAQVIYFEPLSRNVARIERNLKLNRQEAKIEQSAVSNFTGEAAFYDMNSHENTIASFSREFVEQHRHHTKIIPIQVPVITLDKYLAENKIPGVDLVKIDVEGADFEVLDGFRNSMAKYKPDILIEITNEASAEKINQLLTSLNLDYKLFEIDDSKGELIPRKNITKKQNRNFLLCKAVSAKILEGV